MSFWRLAALLGVVAAPLPAVASRTGASSAEALFVRARAAEVIGMPGAAAAGYASALAARPGDTGLAMRAFRQAIAAGDFTLAARMAATMRTQRALPVEAQIFQLASAVREKDWTAAAEAAAVLEKDELFGFLGPTLRAWLAVGSRSGDPLALVEGGSGSLAGAYRPEHRALIQLVRGELDQGVAAIRALASTAGARQARLRLVAAAALQKAGRKADALAMLAGEDSGLDVGRALIAAGKPIPGRIDGAADGLAELFTRLSVDINRERSTPLSLFLARIATMLSPQNAETWLVTSELLSAAGQNDAALDALAKVTADDPFAPLARATRIQILSRAGRLEPALAEALHLAQRPAATAADWVRVADLYGQMERQAEAADAYGRALAKAEAEGGDANARWTLWLLRGGARERAGQWPQAKADLEKAAALAPEEPVVLNYLGYAQIERRENLVAARKLIEKASSLRPDDAAITDSLGWAYYLDGDIARAVETLERAAAREPAETTINEHLGDAYWTAGRRREARFAWRAALVHAEPEDATRIATKLDQGLSPAVAAP